MSLVIVSVVLAGARPASAFDPGEIIDMFMESGDIGSRYGAAFSLISARRSVYETPVDAESEDVGSTYGISAEVAAMPLRTTFGGGLGLEAGLGLSAPFLEYFFGGVQTHFGMILEPAPLGPLSLRVSGGAGFDGHAHLYVTPRATLDLRIITLEGSYKYVPARFSRPYRGEVLPGEVAIGERRIRGAVWINAIPSSTTTGVIGLHLFLEKIQLTTTAPEFLTNSKIVPGDYWNAGIGFSL
ncbi:MAG: hypothetical protein VYE40_19470 [Myxococcota bacterium]|nr:hypothetical protein [Myxococcota bacterium]MEC9443279.1 hypothetical protein [Myxococcota bacterium]